LSDEGRPEQAGPFLMPHKALAAPNSRLNISSVYLSTKEKTHHKTPAATSNAPVAQEILYKTNDLLRNFLFICIIEIEKEHAHKKFKEGKQWRF